MPSLSTCECLPITVHGLHFNKQRVYLQSPTQLWPWTSVFMTELILWFVLFCIFRRHQFVQNIQRRTSAKKQKIAQTINWISYCNNDVRTGLLDGYRALGGGRSNDKISTFQLSGQRATWLLNHLREDKMMRLLV